jgi:DNA-binding MarR family transcriptional regulator
MDNAYRLDRSPVHLLHRALQAAEEFFRQGTTSGLTPRQLAVLVTVAEHEGTNQIDLSELTGTDRTTAAEVVRRLARKGFLQRRRSRSDVRAYVLKVTEDGLEAMRAGEPVELFVDARVLAVLPEARREAFMAALQAICARYIPGVQARRRPPSRRPRRRSHMERTTS